MKQTIILSIMLLLFGCSMSSSNSVVEEIPSPSGRLKAIVFERNAGATTSFSTQISIIQSSKELKNDSGNIFVADCDHGKAPSASWGGPEVLVKWIDDQTLLITHHPDARLFKSETEFQGCKIKYFANQELEPTVKTPVE